MMQKSHKMGQKKKKKKKSRSAMLEIILRMDISQSSSHKRCSMLLAPQSISYTPSLCVQLSLQPKAFPFKLLKEPQRWHFPSVKKKKKKKKLEMSFHTVSSLGLHLNSAAQLKPDACLLCVSHMLY